MATVEKRVEASQANLCGAFCLHFTPGEEAALGVHLRNVSAAVHAAIADLERLIAGGGRAGAIQRRVGRWFRGASGPAGPGDAPDDQDDRIGVGDYRALVHTLAKVRDGLGTRPVRFRSHPLQDGGTWAWRRRHDPLLKGTDVIRIYPRFWAEGPSFQAGVVFHELTHWYADTRDYGYLETPYLPGRYVKGGVRVFLSTQQRTNNADSYEGFLAYYLKRYYPRSKPTGPDRRGRGTRGR